MHQSFNSSSFNDLKQRIEDIKKRNIMLSKKFKRSELNKSSIDDNVSHTDKREVLDDMEVSAVENCYKKALEFAEYSVKLKNVRKRQRIQLIDKNCSDSNVMCESNIRKRCKIYKTTPFTSQINNLVDNSLNKKCTGTHLENKSITILNEEEIFIDTDHSNSSLFSRKNKDRKRRKFESHCSKLDSTLLKSNAVKHKSKIVSSVNYITENQVQNVVHHPVINALTSTPNKHCIKKRKNMCDELIHQSDSSQKTKHSITTLSNSGFNKSSKHIISSKTSELIERNYVDSNSNDDIIFIHSICSAEKPDIQTQNKSKSNNEIKKLKSKQKQSKSNEGLQIALNQDGNESDDEIIKHSNNVSLKTTHSSEKLTNKSQPKKNTKFWEKSISNLEAVSIAASDKEFENRTGGTRNLAKNTLKKPLTTQEIDVIKDPAETIITEINLIEESDYLNKTNFDLTVKHDEIEKNALRGIDSMKNLCETTFTPEIDLTEEPIEKIIPELDLTKDPVEGIIPEFDLTEEYGEGATPEFDLTELNILQEESIMPELDFTEEPVDFPIPKLHLDESTGISKEKVQFLKSKGIIIRSGLWSKTEEEILERNFRDFQNQFGIYDTHLLLGIGRRLPSHQHEYSEIKKFLKAKHFYVRLGKDISYRTLHSIYYKARLMLNSFKKHKDITPNDLSAIIELQKKYGNNWSLIGQKLGICPNVCLNIYSYHKKPCRKGKWSKSETKNLFSAIKSVTKVSDLNEACIKGMSWDRVAELVPTRNYLQCHNEWHNNQSKLFKNVIYEK